MSMELDMREFNQTLAQYATRSKRTLAEILNRKMLRILLSAFRATPKADRSRIETEMNVVAYKVSRSRKTGKLKRGKAVISGLRVFTLVNARREKDGLAPISGKAMEKAARRFVGRMLGAVGSLRAGWMRAIRVFMPLVNNEGSPVESVPKVKQNSIGKTAKDGWDPVAQVEYNLTVIKGGSKIIEPRLEQALATAFKLETADMQRYIERKMQEDADKINAR